MLSFEVLMRSVLVSDLPSMMSRRGCKPSCVSSWSSGFRALEYDPGAFMMQVRAHREVHCMLGRVACLQGIKDRTNHIIRKGSCLIYIYIFQNDSDITTKFLNIKIIRCFSNHYRYIIRNLLPQDIEQYNRFCEIYNISNSIENRYMDDIENSVLLR